MLSEHFGQLAWQFKSRSGKLLSPMKSVVILCWRLIRKGERPMWNPETSLLLRTAAVFVIRVI